VLSGESVEMSFNVKEFIAHLSKFALDSLLKMQLRQVVLHLKIPIDGVEKAKKAELKCAALDYLVEEDLISDEDLNGVGNELEIKRLELESTREKFDKLRQLILLGKSVY